MADKIRVLIVDDSVLMREALKDILEQDSGIEVVGLAHDGKEGVEKALTLKPNVITMDLKMPILGGIEAIEEIMEENPIPIIVVSSMDFEVISRALNMGAMDFVAVNQDVEKIAKDLTEKIKLASRVRPLRRMHIKLAACPKVLPACTGNLKVVAVGVSTGGPQALQILLSSLSADFHGAIVIVQHISKGFLAGLVEWLTVPSCFKIAIAKAGDILKERTIYFAPDDFNLEVGRNGCIILKEDTTRAMLHVPSIDVMMKSVAASFGHDAIGLIMTGMGSDGVEGIAAIKRSGGKTVSQDEATSVIFGMNRIAVEKGLIDHVVGLDKIAEKLLELSRE